jgi:hypothetical protein
VVSSVCTREILINLEFSSRSRKRGERISEMARDIWLLLWERMEERNGSCLTSSLTR